MTPDFDDKARTIQKVKAQLGWEGDIESFIKRVHDLDKGLVNEDEFLYLLGWAGKCKLFHKLDQSIIPPDSKENYTIPDLLTAFDREGKVTPYLIEVKTSKKDSLSWSEKYYQGLKNYSSLTGIPILVAWKWSQFGIWMLFDINHFKKGPSNFKIDYKKALMENLMSSLAGDYFVVPYDEFAMCFKFKKLKKLKQEGNEIVWETIVEEIYFEGENRIKVTDIDPGIFSLMLSLSTELESIEDDTHIINRYYPSPNINAFAQSIPIKLARGLETNEVNWVEKIRNGKYSISYDKLYQALVSGIDSKIIRNILHTNPNTDWEKGGS